MLIMMNTHQKGVPTRHFPALVQMLGTIAVTD